MSRGEGEGGLEGGWRPRRYIQVIEKLAKNYGYQKLTL